MNQGKLEVVKQEMARVNIDILGTHELKWTGMGGFNSDDHYICYCRQESPRSQANSTCRASDDIMSPGTPLAAASHLTKLKFHREGLISCPKGRVSFIPGAVPVVLPWLLKVEHLILKLCACPAVSDSCDPGDCSLPGSSVHGISQSRILEWVAISYSRGSSRPRN